MLDILITVVYSPFTAVLCTCIIVRLPEKGHSWRIQNFYIVSKPFFLYMYNY